MSFSVIDHGNQNARSFESRAEADDKARGIKQMVSDPSAIEVVKGDYGDYESFEADDTADTEDIEPEVIDHSPDGGQAPSAESQSIPSSVEQETTEAIDKLGESLEDDPLNILPDYMITYVDGKPSLNKRGVSVLAYHYGITVKEKETVAYPHENDFETAVIEIVVEGQDGRVFTGSGEATIDETPKHQLLRMAETRAYKRAVIFATGTGIVGYQELVESL